MGLLGSSCCKLYAADVIKGCRYDERLKNGEDVEFNFRVYRGLKKAVYLNRPFYHYRQLGNSAVRNYNPKNDGAVWLDSGGDRKRFKRK